MIIHVITMASVTLSIEIQTMKESIENWKN